MTSSPFHTAHKSQFGQLPSAYGTLRGPLSHLHDDFMLSPEAPPAAAAGQSGAAGQRWCELIDAVVSLLTARTGSVFVDCAPTSTATVSSASQAAFATRLAAALAERTTTGIRVARGAEAGDIEAEDVVIWLRTPADNEVDGQRRRKREERADIVIDLHDPDWPVIRRVAARLAARGDWYLTETRAFFGRRAATWDTRFGDDLPAYTAAINQAAIPGGGVVLDIGCGSGRALRPLRQAVGPAGSVIALDLTPEMLAVARPASIAARAALVLADARSLPLADASADAIFAAGLVDHLPDTEAGLRELARVTRKGGLLVLFHPSGRAALAARHGRVLAADEPLAEGMLRRYTAAAGWELTAYDDATHRFFAVAERR
jgi:SAM-dependent methyltransferase